MNKGRSKKQQIALAVCGAIVVVSLVASFLSNRHPNNANTTATRTVKVPPSGSHPPRSSPTPLPQPSTTPEPLSGPENQATSLAANGPVIAAKDAMQKLEKATLQPASEANAIAEGLTAPSALFDEELTLHYKGIALATSKDIMGYSSVAAARKHARYSFLALKFYPNKITSNTAKITLYGTQDWRSPPKSQVQREHLSPYMQVVYMKRLKDASGKKKWFFVRQEEPPSGWEPPRPAHKITYGEAVKRFAPYLRNFKDIYVTTG